MHDYLTITQAAPLVKRAPETVRRACALPGNPLGARRSVLDPRGAVWLVPRAVCTPEAYAAAVGKPGRRPGAKE